MRFLKLPVIAFLIIIYCSCSKTNTTLSPDFYILYGDTTAFSSNLVLFGSADTLLVNVIISSSYLTSKNVDVTVAADVNAVAAYNDSSGTNYQLMPANAYSFTPTVTHLTTEIYDTIPVTFYKSAFNTSANLMLPITITGAGGYAISSGAATIYLHTISSKISGHDTAIGTKVYYIGDTLSNSIDSTINFSLAKDLIPENGDSSTLDYADLGPNGWQYLLTLSPTGVLTVTPNAVILSAVETGSFRILSASYNAANQDIFIRSTYKNTSGNARIVEESLSLE